MKILALEFSPPDRTAAVVVDGQVRGFGVDREPRSSVAFALVAQVLSEAGLSAAEMDCLAVGLGPGSFAGTRMAIAMAQGWQLARGTKILGVSSADAIARLAQREGIFGTVSIVFDAQRNEAFAARYTVNAEEVNALETVSLLTPEIQRRRREDGEIFLKADGGPWSEAGARTLFSDARVIGNIASRRNDFVPGSALEPVYLRKAEFLKAPSPRFAFPEAGQ
jgi:tRNA threonylcarbamoyl adenosine modification protein YeaZ